MPAPFQFSAHQVTQRQGTEEPVQAPMPTATDSLAASPQPSLPGPGRVTSARTRAVADVAKPPNHGFTPAAGQETEGALCSSAISAAQARSLELFRILSQLINPDGRAQTPGEASAAEERCKESLLIRQPIPRSWALRQAACGLRGVQSQPPRLSPPAVPHGPRASPSSSCHFQPLLPGQRRAAAAAGPGHAGGGNWGCTKGRQTCLRGVIVGGCL